mmetsp:Transcript_78711/g.132009  ORF Transcript_78711/g.132009 Transcript_78711/m.132009 type:complete len:97 (-) Transcript_78711:502-792(-)
MYGAYNLPSVGFEPMYQSLYPPLPLPTLHSEDEMHRHIPGDVSSKQSRDRFFPCTEHTLVACGGPPPPLLGGSSLLPREGLSLSLSLSLSLPPRLS